MKKSFIHRIILWSLERFPPIQILPAFLTFSIVCIPLATAKNLSQILFHGTFIVFSILLILRVLDEHKDYESDLKSHPERLLQKQVLSLLDLRKVAIFFATASACVIVVFYFKMTTLMSLLALIVWSYLMTKEFFSHNWLTKNLLIYSISHLLISPILIYFCATIADTQNNDSIIGMMLISFFSAFSYEVARKIKGSDEKNVNESNYVNSYGVSKPLILWITVSVFALISSSAIVQITEFKLLFYVCSLLYVLIAAFLFHKQPIKKYRKLNEAAAGMVGLVSFLVPLTQMFYA